MHIKKNSNRYLRDNIDASMTSSLPTNSTANNSKLVDVALDIIWPTRCAICDQHGTLLCKKCKDSLNFIDQNQACAKCGAANCKHICSECSSLGISQAKHKSFAFKRSRSVLVFDDLSSRIIRAYKDQGELRLASEIASLMNLFITPDIKENCLLSYIPSSSKSIKKRGFDNGKVLYEQLKDISGMKGINAFLQPKSQDQRDLGLIERSNNMVGNFILNNKAKSFIALTNPRILLIDDVFTTGATLHSASSCLLAGGASEVECLTLLKVD